MVKFFRHLLCLCCFATLHLYSADCFTFSDYVTSAHGIFELDGKTDITLDDFYDIVFGGKRLVIHPDVNERLDETRRFVDYLLEKNIKVYGLTTGFADLRNNTVSPCEASLLSKNILTSHDAGIGPPLPKDVVLGAMVLRAKALSKGHSAIKKETLKTLVDMVNARIIPVIPDTGSLGASGDLAFLARLGRAMCGEDVPVCYKGKRMSAEKALKLEHIRPFDPGAKEGLALTNGTSFMASMLAIGFLREVHELENIIALENLFLNSVQAIDAAFLQSIQKVRGQKGQKKIAEVLLSSLKGSPFIDRQGVQNDYCIRCLPQILGPKLDMISSVISPITKELNAVTDNPLIYRDDEISSDVHEERIFNINGKKWAVLSGGNFHGEYIATIADTLTLANAKIALTMDRQMTYMLNPWRNGKILPAYLIPNEKKVGLMSGYMITQYTLNAITQKICFLATPITNFNLTSANESEDVVSYGASAAHKLIDQLDHMQNLNVVYLATVLQAYSIMREHYTEQTKKPLSPNLTSERLYAMIIDHMEGINYPTYEEIAFGKIYSRLRKLLMSSDLRHTMGYPIAQDFNVSCIAY